MVLKDRLRTVKEKNNNNNSFKKNLKKKKIRIYIFLSNNLTLSSFYPYSIACLHLQMCPYISNTERERDLDILLFKKFASSPEN